jgi:hypothetical protein
MSIPEEDDPMDFDEESEIFEVIGEKRNRIEELNEEIGSLRKELKNTEDQEKREALRGDIDLLGEEKAGLLLEVQELEELLSDKRELVSKIDETRGEMRSTLENARDRLSEIDSEFNRIQEDREEVDELVESLNQKSQRISELEDTAEGLLERTTSAALGDQFSKRSSEIEDKVRFWRRASFGSIAVLVVSSIVIYGEIAYFGADAISSVSKLALILPISVVVWFTVSNYQRQQKIMEDYEFKARVALSLNGFRNVLNQEVSEENENVVADFVVETMNKIYTNPQENIEPQEGDNDETPLLRGQKPLVELIRRN